MEKVQNNNDSKASTLNCNELFDNYENSIGLFLNLASVEARCLELGKIQDLDSIFKEKADILKIISIYTNQILDPIIYKDLSPNKKLTFQDLNQKILDALQENSKILDLNIRAKKNIIELFKKDRQKSKCLSYNHLGSYRTTFLKNQNSLEYLI